MHDLKWTIKSTRIVQYGAIPVGAFPGTGSTAGAAHAKTVRHNFTGGVALHGYSMPALLLSTQVGCQSRYATTMHVRDLPTHL